MDAVTLNDLPDEIVEFILTYLPPYNDLENCRLVSKRWCGIVKNLIRRSKLNLRKGLLDFRLQWTRSDAKNGPNVPTIAGRFSHSAVRLENSMYVFGGGSSSDTTFNDLWRFDLSEMRWERPLSLGSYPSPKGSASMVSWENQLVLFGGWRYPSLYPPYQPWCLFDELHYYHLNDQSWTLHVLTPGPPPMAGHSATVHGDRMIVFGGYQIADGVNSINNETWCLNLNEPRWWQPHIKGNIKPPPRYGQFQVELDETHLLVVGGCGGPNSVYSDAWLLDMSQNDCWSWRSIPIRSKNFSASHMWCNPACKVNSQLVVLGPTPNMPQHFLMVKPSRVPIGAPLAPAAQRIGAGQLDGLGVGVGVGIRSNRRQNAAAGDFGNVLANHHRRENIPNGVGNGVENGVGNGVENGVGNDPAYMEEYAVNRRAIVNQHMQSANYSLNNNHNANGNNNNCNNNNVINNIGGNLQPRTGRLSDLHVAAASSLAIEEYNHNRPSTSSANLSNNRTGLTAANGMQNGIMKSGSSSNSNEIEAANRLQRNLALRCRENEPLLPKRFDELYEDPFRMAAFNVQNRPRSLSKDHNERIRRMEAKMNAIRNSRRNVVATISEPPLIQEPSPKRVKRNMLSLFVCDLKAALSPSDPHLQWIEYKNNGIIPGAPERLILSSMVVGHGELILFGGVHKETLGEITHQVSNAIHFLSAPRDIV